MNKKGNGWALLPLLVFIIVYVSSALLAKDFYAVSVIVPFLAATLVSLLMNRKVKFDEILEKLKTAHTESEIGYLWDKYKDVQNQAYSGFCPFLGFFIPVLWDFS